MCFNGRVSTQSSNLANWEVVCHFQKAILESWHLFLQVHFMSPWNKHIFTINTKTQQPKIWSLKFGAYTAQDNNQNVIWTLSLQNKQLPTTVRMFLSCIKRHCPVSVLPWWEGSCAVSCSRPPLSFPRQSQPFRLLGKKRHFLNV